jgi:hypothetical protein
LKRKSSDYRNNIHISINNIRVDKIKLPLGSMLNQDSGMRTCHSLGLGHNIKAQIKDDILCVKISSRIALDLYRKEILKPDTNSIYEIEIFDWKAKCFLSEIFYGDINKSYEENVFILFKVVEELQNNSSKRDQFEQVSF